MEPVSNITLDTYSIKKTHRFVKYSSVNMRSPQCLTELCRLSCAAAAARMARARGIICRASLRATGATLPVDVACGTLGTLRTHAALMLALRGG